jgi:cytosine/adenosine deaminase-related metal-dependent hydrolase
MGDAHSIPPEEGAFFGSGGPEAPVPPTPGRQLVHAGVVADARQRHAPGAVLLEGGSILAVGSPEAIGAPADTTILVSRPDSLVCPPLVNAHVHLDLSDLPAPAEPLPFPRWLARVQAHRRAQTEPGAVERAVQQGVEASREGGCPFVGDICGSERALSAVKTSPIRGVAFLEVIGHDARSSEALAQIKALGVSESDPMPLQTGITPHAPYSTGAILYEAAAASGRRVATHLAESMDELTWCRQGDGPISELLERVGYSPGSVDFPGSHPIDATLPRLPGSRSVVVHLNYIDQPGHLDRLAESGVTVAFCPRASVALGHPETGQAPHAWRAMLRHGIPVALGTDGRPCLPGPGLGGRRLSVLDDALELINRWGATCEEWLPMATLHGARALGLAPDSVLLTPGPKHGLLAVELADRDRVVPAADKPLEWLFLDDHAPVDLV